MIGEAVQTLLRGEGHAVDWVRDGLQADAALCPGPGGGHGYDMVLLDLGLPGQDGLQCCAACAGAATARRCWWPARAMPCATALPGWMRGRRLRGQTL